MANKKIPFKGRYNGPQRLISCSCGGEAKLTKKKNYPFGAKSKGITTKFYKCKNCGKKFN